MKRWAFGMLWLAALVAASAALGRWRIPHGLAISPAGVGAMLGAAVFFTLAGLTWLPGLRRPEGPAPWSWPQAVWLVLQFFNMQFAAQIICVLLALAVVYASVRLGHRPPPQTGGVTLVVSIAAGYAAAGLWSLWYIGRRRQSALRDGGLTGIGWCAAPRQAYAAAIGALLVLGLFAALVQHVLPPDAAAIKQNPLQMIFGGARWKLGVLFGLAAVAAPFVEEFVFRGGVFSALSPSCGVVGAAIITTLVFTAAHTLEAIHYLPGLLVIGAAGTALVGLRIKFRSIRPGILLHVMFNGAAVLAVAFSH